MLAAPSAQLLEELECWENYKPRFANEENSQKHRGNQEGGGKEARKPGKTPAHGIIELQKGAEWRRAPGL